ncbi:hypothetical protein BASA50_003277 [Batrachochytrium salamandrivorans]|uniref:Uncharacterized protein n=1 Tax=Batrachochytrium salamandrivorans TaxID=1357716 RepID=A0ABQ8FK89_9FUNG|nr:hypothetical protein BASA50_003277 [Batrachochytrium salamandrivorans]
MREGGRGDNHSFCRPELDAVATVPLATPTGQPGAVDPKPAKGENGNPAPGSAATGAANSSNNKQQQQQQPPGSAAAQPVPATPKRFMLTSNFVYLRQNYHKKRQQAKSAKIISSQMPSVPKRNGF